MYRLIECKLCRGRSLFTLYSQAINYAAPWSGFLERSNFPLTMQGKICSSCGWIFKDIGYDAEELARLYNLKDDAVSAEAEMLADKNAKYRGLRIFQTVEPWLPPVGKVLDVGGRNGELMQTFLDRGFEVSVLDMDAGHPISPAISKIRSPFLAWDADRFDLLTMSHVLEHTESPGDFLSHARQLLKEDGLVFVEVPSELLTCLIKRHVGDHRHLCYFTRETLKAYLEISGFECLSCKLLVDLVGSRIPLLRAVARKGRANAPIGALRANRGALIRSLAEVLHPLPWLARVPGWA